MCKGLVIDSCCDTVGSLVLQGLGMWGIVSVFCGVGNFPGPLRESCHLGMYGVAQIWSLPPPIRHGAVW